MVRAIRALPLAVIFLAPAAFAKSTIAVGSCDPNVIELPTIQAAVNAVGVNGTVLLCPGTYPEQVVIAKSLTLKGLASGTSAQAIIVPPAGGVVANTTSVEPGGGPIAAQVLVQNGATVTISGVTVDGAGNGITGCAPDIIGIYYQNASGAVRSSLVRNQVLDSPDLIGCQSGEGIFVETGNGGTASVVIQGNYVENYQKNGVTANGAGATATVSNNTIQGQGPTTGAAENSIQLAFGATGTVTGNKVGGDIWAPDTITDTGDAAAGILIYDSPGVAIKSNIVDSTQFGIAVVADGQGSADGATVSGNTVAATHLFDAVDICGAGSAGVTGNILGASDESAIHLDSSCTTPSTANTVSNNTINGACAGVLEGSGSGGSIGTNTFVNTGTTVLTGSDTCPVTPPGQHSARTQAAHRHASPARF
jgi:hypothetical protein